MKTMAEYTIADGIKTLIDGKSIDSQQMENVMGDIMSGKANDIQISSFLTALRIRGETPDVISGAASTMRKFSNKIVPVSSSRLVDTCGTGGDGSNTFNISTLAAFIAAGAGAVIAKHGNRSVSSKCGSADLLEAFGVKIDLDPAEVEKIINEIGIGFMFAPKFHPAMKYAMPVRKTLGVRTIFNILGPLTNPAAAKGHVLGVFDQNLVEIMAKVMATLGSEQVYIVHSEPGIDEIVPISKVYISEVQKGEVKSYVKTAKDFNIKKCTLKDMKGGSLDINLKIGKEILKNEDQSVKRQVVLINAAYAILASGIASCYEDAFKKAEESLVSGAALNKLKVLVEKSSNNLEKFNQIFA